MLTIITNSIAGSDTSGAILTFALQFLLDNPETLEILIEEVDAAVPSLNDPITAENTKNLVYLNAVINETLRLRPPTPQGTSVYSFAIMCMLTITLRHEPGNP